jgi:hypothetical protein
VLTRELSYDSCSLYHHTLSQLHTYTVDNVLTMIAEELLDPLASTNAPSTMNQLILAATTSILL